MAVTASKNGKSTLTSRSKLASRVVVKSVTFLCLEGPRFKISIGRPAVFRHFMVFISSSSKIPEIRLIYFLPIHYLLPYFRSLVWNRKLEKIQMNSCDSLSKKGDINVRLYTRHATSRTFPVYRTAIRRSTLCSFNLIAIRKFICMLTIQRLG